MDSHFSKGIDKVFGPGVAEREGAGQWADNACLDRHDLPNYHFEQVEYVKVRRLTQ